MTVTTPEDRRFRRGQVAIAGRRRRGWRARLLRRLLVGGLVATGLALAVREAAVAAGRLRVDTIRVIGNERVPTARILEALDGLEGRPIVGVDLETWRDRLRHVPWIRDASLRRVLPGTVEVAVSERRPLAIGRTGSRLVLVDVEGTVIDEVGPGHAAWDLPIIDGLVGAGAAGAPTPSVQAAGRLLGELAADPALLARVSQVDVSDPDNVAVWIDGDGTRLLVGRHDFRRRLLDYLDVREALRARVSEIDTVDLRFDRRLFVRPLGEADRPAGEARRGSRAPS